MIRIGIVAKRMIGVVLLILALAIAGAMVLIFTLYEFLLEGVNHL